MDPARHNLLVVAPIFGWLAVVPAVLGGCARPPKAPAVTQPTASAASATGPKDDPRGPKSSHLEALGRLLDAPWTARVDKRRIISLPLPDGAAWTHVKFWGVTTVAGYRYGDEHHAVAAVFTFGAAAGVASVDTCAARFQKWGREHGKNFDILIGEARVDSFAWGRGEDRAKVFVLDAERRSLFSNKRYAAAYVVYPAWTDACLVVGVAAPEDEDGATASKLRDRLVRDALPAVVAKDKSGPLALEAKIDVD